jgi:radical SAM superfamily enzyme YgiQ (UPF0313 family)
MTRDTMRSSVPRRVTRLSGIASGVLHDVLNSTSALSPEADWDALELLLDPWRLKEQLLERLGSLIRQVVVAGPIDNRLLLLEKKGGRWIAAHMSGKELGRIAWPEFLKRDLVFETPDHCISATRVSASALARLSRPRIQLVALYHPENFPLPRFPLGISDVARAVRSRFQGSVKMCDMQFGDLTVSSLMTELENDRPDILGISATFGQYDILEQVSHAAQQWDQRTLLVFGGSLCALNASRLLRDHPAAIVALGPGEESMQDIVEYWHGDMPLSEVRGISYLDEESGEVRTRRIANLTANDFLPELDLLQLTLASRGVMQLESSRGCTHACSFCPRDHKGTWAGEEADHIDEILGVVGEIFDRSPEIARKIFLVDEEFVGPESQGIGLARARRISRKLSSHGFRWETSSRIDQVYRPDKDRDWHLERIRFWRGLLNEGLDRCLFGVESGVDSILKRFNKKTSAPQNALGIRLLTACGVPIRSTYITFDHLMTFEELLASYIFQGRRDLILKPQPQMGEDELFDLIQDDALAASNALNVPFYVSISYMLVSMECLLGSAYLRKVEEANLAMGELPAMGRRNARFRDPAIGIISQCGQLWIDRNFSLDYTLKSLEKISAGDERKAVRRVRTAIKESAYELLGKFLELVTSPSMISPIVSHGDKDFLNGLSGIMDQHFQHLVSIVDNEWPLLEVVLHPVNAAILRREDSRWRSRREWTLINN